MQWQAIERKPKQKKPACFMVPRSLFLVSFFRDHAAQIESERQTAILEMIPSSFDTGATKLDIVCLEGREASLTWLQSHSVGNGALQIQPT